jgi:hypothetical protein
MLPWLLQGITDGGKSDCVELQLASWFVADWVPRIVEAMFWKK